MEACSLPAAASLFMSRRCGGRAVSQWGILHGHVIWALCLDTAHEGQAYLWRARWNSYWEEEAGGGGALPLNRSFMETACVLWCIYTSMLQSDKTHAKCISILNTDLCILQHSYHLADVQFAGGAEMRWNILWQVGRSLLFTKCLLSCVNTRSYLGEGWSFPRAQRTGLGLGLTELVKQIFNILRNKFLHLLVKTQMRGLTSPLCLCSEYKVAAQLGTKTGNS